MLFCRLKVFGIIQGSMSTKLRRLQRLITIYSLPWFYIILGFLFKWLVLAYFFYICWQRIRYKRSNDAFDFSLWQIVLKYENLRFFVNVPHARLHFLFAFLHFGVFLVSKIRKVVLPYPFSPLWLQMIRTE